MTFRLSEPSRIRTRPDRTGFQATLRGARYWKSLSGGYDSLHPRLRSARPCRDFEDVYTLQGATRGIQPPQNLSPERATQNITHPKSTITTHKSRGRLNGVSNTGDELEIK